jgi:uncharacterized membrane protein YphA (DoxX/SURF4 family)
MFAEIRTVIAAAVLALLVFAGFGTSPASAQYFCFLTFTSIAVTTSSIAILLETPRGTKMSAFLMVGFTNSS